MSSLVFTHNREDENTTDVDSDNTGEDIHSGNKHLIFVLDWELCHLSSIVVDLGTMLAELWILYFFEDCPSAPLIITSFLEAYGSVDKQDALDTMIYFGVHLIIWPCRTEWSSSPKLMECIQFGCDCLENAYAGNAEWFKDGLFQGLFPSEGWKRLEDICIQI